MNKKHIVLACLVVALAAMLAGCSGAGASGSASSSQQEASSTAGSSSAGALLASSYDWPADKIDSVPEPKTSGVITSLDVNDAAAGIGYEGMTEAEVAQYVEDLKAAGFTSEAQESRSQTSYSYNARNENEYGNWVSVTFVLDESKQGGTTTSILVFLP